MGPPSLAQTRPSLWPPRRRQVAGLKLIEYRWLVLEYSVEIYGGLVAAVFAAVGIWLGRKLTRHTETVVVREVMVRAPVDFLRDQSKLEALGITPRELEILELIAAGLSNREIAQRVHVSENTVKTHSGDAHCGGRRVKWAVLDQLGVAMQKIVLTFGLIAGAILSALMLITLPFLGQIGFDKGAIIGYTTMVLAFLMVFVGVKSYRDNVAGGSVTFGRAFKVGLLITAGATDAQIAQKTREMAGVLSRKRRPAALG